MPGIESSPCRVQFRSRLLKSYTTRFAVILGIALSLLTGLLRAEFLYVANAGDNTISAYRIDLNGALTPVAGSPFPARVSDMAVDLFGRFLYSTNFLDNNGISAYRISENGVLKPVVGSPFPAANYAGSVAVDPFGGFVYVVNDKGVLAYRIAKNGALTPVAGSPFPAGMFPGSVAVDPLGGFVYVANDGGILIPNETVSAYRIHGNGALKPVAGSPFPNGEEPESIEVDPLGRFVYTGDFYNSFSAYSIARNGALTPLIGSPYRGTYSTAVAADPLGRFVYVGDMLYSVWAYRVSPNGTLTSVAGSPFRLGFSPRSMAVDLLGRFLYMSNASGNNVSAYRIGQNGALTPVGGSPFAAGIYPGAMTVSP